MSNISIPDRNDFSDVDVDSIQCINKMCDVIMSMNLDNVYINQKASMFNPFAVGFGPGKVFRFDRGSILFSTAGPPSEDFLDLQMGEGQRIQDVMETTTRGNSSTVLEEEAYVYETPGVAISWFLCKMGFGTNESNLEADRITFRPQSPSGKIDKEVVVRLCFEKERTPEQKMMYRAFATSLDQMESAQMEAIKDKMDQKIEGPSGGETENPFQNPSEPSGSLGDLLGDSGQGGRGSVDLFGPKKEEGGSPFSDSPLSNPFGDSGGVDDRSAFFGRCLLDKIKASH